MNSIPASIGFNVIGFASGNLGLGVAARNVIELIKERNDPLAILDLDPGLGRGGFVTIYPELTYTDPRLLPYPINIFVLAAPSLAEVRSTYGETMFNDERLNAAFSFWELPVLDKACLAALNAMDVVIGCSDSMRSTYEFGLSGPYVLSGRLPVRLPSGIKAHRERFSLPEKAFVFACSFEPYSDARRKNPAGVVDAFIRAFGDSSDTALVIRINNPTPGGQRHSTVDEVRGAAAEHPTIYVIDEPLTYVDVLSLYASSDVYVSLHRAEGLGLAPLEAMMLGKPVIATAWSGNMTYMDHCNSCLVPYRLIPVDGTMRQYSQESLGPTALWADPDIDQAAAWMKRLVDDRELYEKLSIRASTDAELFNLNARQGKVLDELRAVWDNGRFLPRRARFEPVYNRIQAALEAKDARIEHLQGQLDWIESRKVYRALRKVKRFVQRD